MNQVSGILKKLVPLKGKSNAAVGAKLGISGQLLGQYINGRHKPKPDFYAAWKRVYGEDLLEMIETNVSHETLASEPQTYLEKRRDSKNNTTGSIPVFVGSTRAGTIQVYSDDPESQIPIGHLPANVFPGCNHAERVSGDSMHPIIINQGYVIGKIVDKRGIIYGEKYIVHTKYGQSVVKYVQKGTKQNLIKLVSYNKHIEPQEIQTDDITFLCRVYFIVNPS